MNEIWLILLINSGVIIGAIIAILMFKPGLRKVNAETAEKMASIANIKTENLRDTVTMVETMVNQFTAFGDKLNISNLKQDELELRVEQQEIKLKRQENKLLISSAKIKKAEEELKKMQAQLDILKPMALYIGEALSKQRDLALTQLQELQKKIEGIIESLGGNLTPVILPTSVELYEASLLDLKKLVEQHRIFSESISKAIDEISINITPATLIAKESHEVTDLSIEDEHE